MSTRAAWIAVPLGSLNVALAMLGLLFAGLNGYSLIRYLEELVLATSILAVSVSVVGMIVASHRPRNPLGWIFLAIGFTQSLVNSGWPYAKYALRTDPASLPGGPLMAWLGSGAWIPGISLMLTFVPLLFPDGRLPSRRWRPVAWLSAVPLAIFVVEMAWLWPYRGRTLIEHPGQVKPGALLAITLDLLFPLMLVCGLACVFSLMVRFWYSRGVERQQIKSFAYATTGFLATLVAVEYLPFEPIMLLLALLIVPVVPVALGLSILRYRLYEIDILINRTLVYGSLTAMLVLVYLGGVVALQAALRVLTGQESALAVVASTLAIAALVNPLRRRVQAFVDRHFYRRKYDATKTLDAFSIRLRDETQLDTLSEDLIGVVTRTVQPAHASLWLRPKPGPKDEQAN